MLEKMAWPTALGYYQGAKPFVRLRAADPDYGLELPVEVIAISQIPRVNVTASIVVISVKSNSKASRPDAAPITRG